MSPLPLTHELARHLAVRLGALSLAVALFAGLYLQYPSPWTGGIAAGVTSFAAGLFAVELERHVP